MTPQDQTPQDKANEWLRKCHVAIHATGEVWKDGKLLAPKHAAFYKRIYKTILNTPIKH